MKTNMDFMKIDRGELGVINFNNMLPVELKFNRKIDPEQLPQETDEEMKYKNMCVNNYRGLMKPRINLELF